MKKLVLLLAVVFSVSLFSCGGSEEAKTNQDSIEAARKADSLKQDSIAKAKAAAEAAAAKVAEEAAKAAEEAPKAE